MPKSAEIPVHFTCNSFVKKVGELKCFTVELTAKSFVDEFDNDINITFAIPETTVTKLLLHYADLGVDARRELIKKIIKDETFLAISHGKENNKVAVFMF